VSFTFDPGITNQLGFAGNRTFGLSTNGVNGAFVAAQSGDVGSPGRVVNWPSITGIVPVAGGFQVSWFSQPNWDYFVQYKDQLTDAGWQTLTNLTAGATNAAAFVDSTTAAQRFYRVGSKANKTQ
jgi:hypothetical protein